MRYPVWLTAALVVIIVVAVGVLALGDDVLQTPGEERGYMRIRAVDVRPVEITPGEAVFNVTTYIDHYGGQTRNGSISLRAIDTSTGLLATQTNIPLPSVEGESTITAMGTLRVERENGYNLKIMVFDGDRIVETGSVGVKGLGALVPDTHKTGLEVSAIDFIAENTTGGRVRLQTDIYLYNRGANVSESLPLLVKVREANSNLLAQQVWLETGRVESGTTVIKNTSLVVPDEYNYVVEAILWKDRAIVGQWEHTVKLAPTKTMPEDITEKEVDLEVGDFVQDDEDHRPIPQQAREEGPIATPTPGFTALAAAGALAVIVGWRRKYGG